MWNKTTRRKKKGKLHMYNSVPTERWWLFWREIFQQIFKTNQPVICWMLRSLAKIFFMFIFWKITQFLSDFCCFWGFPAPENPYFDVLFDFEAVTKVSCLIFYDYHTSKRLRREKGVSFDEPGFLFLSILMRRGSDGSMTKFTFSKNYRDPAH